MGWHTDKLTLHLNKVAHKLCLNLLAIVQHNMLPSDATVNCSQHAVLC